MAFDRYDDGVDGPGEAKPEQRFRGGGQDADAAVGRTQLAEPRTRQEVYEALRAADGRPVQASDNQRAPGEARTDAPAEARTDAPAQARTHPPAEERTDAPAEERTDRSGWDTVASEKRPPLDAIRVTPERMVHILDGDSTGGGHRHGTGKPGKTEFPSGWNDEKIIDALVDVARKPDNPPVRQDRNDTWLCTGTRANVEVSVVVARSGEIVTGWPEEGGPGVVRNPRRGTS
jgi:Bacterial EndoU nuclease